MFRQHRQFIRWLRASIKHWSPKKDKDYFDVLFSQQHYDPFSASYPGNITIRRFADLTAPFLEGLHSVLDLGCGPGEITCELAKRFPNVSFRGIDHSEAAINQAKSNAQSLDLKNIAFSVADIKSYTPESNTDIVLMFDSFHHLSDPQAFVSRFGNFSPRFLLLEPQGNWKGQWKHKIDFDWLMLELDKIRARLAYNLGEEEPEMEALPEHQMTQQGAPIEHRYTKEDFKKFFSGYGLNIRGTVSGLDTYPPDSFHKSPSRDRFGRFLHDLYKDIDDRLYKQNLDLLAKHWVIYAEKGAKSAWRKTSSKRSGPFKDIQIKGPYDAEYVHFIGPRTAKVNETIRAEVKLRNRSFRVWSSLGSQRPDNLSYHWLNKSGAVLVLDGERSPLPRPVGPDEECDVSMRIVMPDKPGRYVLAVDLVRENASWFSDAGVPYLQIPFRIR